MTRTILPMAVADISAFAKSLRDQIVKHKPGNDGPGPASTNPACIGHVELLNMIARAAGFRNYQHFRADAEAHAGMRAAASAMAASRTGAVSAATTAAFTGEAPTSQVGRQSSAGMRGNSPDRHFEMSSGLPAEALPELPPELPNEIRVARTLRLFDRDGMLTRWPGKRSQQELCLWLIWSKIPRGETYSERQISAFLNGLHSFGDPARLRRDLFDLGLVTRRRDGSDYRRIERKPPPELRLLRARLGTGRAAMRAA